MLCSPTPMEPAPAPVTVPSPGRFTPFGLLLRTFRVWLRNAPAFTLVSLALQLPVASLDLRAGDSDDRGLLLLLGLFAWLVAQITGGALSFGVLRSLEGARPGPLAMLSITAQRLWPIFAVAAVYSAMVVMGFFALVVPGVFVFLAGFLAVPAIVAEPEIGTEGALRRSFVLTGGHRIHLLVALVILIGLELLAQLGVEWLQAGPLASSRPIAVAVRNLVEAVISGFTGSCAAVAYHDLRILKGLSAPRVRA